MALCEEFDVPPVTLDCFPDKHQKLLAIGHIDGQISLCKYQTTIPNTSAPATIKLENQWCKSHKKAVRKIRFGQNGDVYSLTENRALCGWDIETGKKKRCLRTAHDFSPFALHVFARNHTEIIASGDENGIVRVWDFRAEDPQICEFSDHEDYVTDITSIDDGKMLLSTSGDSTLAAYNFPGKKLQMRSEALNAELSCVCCIVTSDGAKKILCGGGDGHLEVFNHQEYGNILERIPTGHEDTVDCVRPIGNNMIATSSNDDGTIRLVHLNPNQAVGEVGKHEDGVEEITVTPDRNWLVSCGHDGFVRFWDLKTWKQKITSVEGSGGDRSRKLKKLRMSQGKEDGFFNNLKSTENSTNDNDDAENGESSSSSVEGGSGISD